MSGISDRRRNPYVGPRSIQPGEPLYGRSEEVHELYSRLQARRIVVLHSPSGAGKSSLVQAGLLPRLREGKFDVWPLIRVNLDPTGLEGVGATTNRYLLSVMSCLEQELPEQRRRSAAQLAELELEAYLDTRPRRKKHQAKPVVLIFDQFEEILTVDPRAVDAKRELFRTLGAALTNERYWALFVIREDFLAAFAPYRDHIPTQMANTFRLDLLGLDGAREAAEQPALSGGRTFPAVDQLIRDLSTTQVQRSDGSFAAEQGLYVEPVQLQVVCRRLWATMPEDDLSIDADNLARYANVSESLASYYADAVAEVAGADVAAERAIREWVGDKLIVGGIRSQIRQGAGRSGGLDNARIEGLLDSYLVRTEQRAGANWFELSHDRLVEPVQQDNEHWEREHLHPLQVQAKLWVNGLRAKTLLLSEEALPEAIAWAEANATLVTDEERQFLDESRELREAERRRRRTAQMRRLAWASVLGLVTLATAAVAVVVARKNQAITRQQEAISAQYDELARKDERLQLQLRSQRGLRASMIADVPGHELEALLLAIEGFAPTHVQTDGLTAVLRDIDDLDGRILDPGELPPPAVFTGLTSALISIRAGVPLLGHRGEVIDVAFSPDGREIATSGSAGTMRSWIASSGVAIRTFDGHSKDVVAVVYSPDGESIGTASLDGTARIWERSSGRLLQSLVHPAPVLDVAFAPDSAKVVTVDTARGLRVWSTGSGDELWALSSPRPLTAVTFAPPAGDHIAISGDDGALEIWDARSGVVVRSFEGHEGTVNDLEYSLDGERLVSAGDDGTARLWDPASGEERARFEHGEVVKGVDISPDGTRVATTTFDDDAGHLWDADTGMRLTSYWHRGPVTDVAFSPALSQIATASWDGTARSWDIRVAQALVTLEGRAGEIDTIALSPGGELVVTGGRDDHVRLWRADSGQLWRVLRGHTLDLTDVSFSPEGELIASASRDGSARLWTADGDPVHVLEAASGRVNAVEFTPSGEQLVTASQDGAVHVWDTKTGVERSFVRREVEIVDVHVSPDGQRLATISANDELKFWDMSSGEAIERPLPNVPVTAATWSQDNDVIAVALKDQSVVVWDIEAETVRLQLTGHAARIGALTFSPDGRRLATASADGTARIWDLDDGVEIVSFRHQRGVRALAFSPTGTHIATASGEPVARLWKLEPQAWLDWGCAVLGERGGHRLAPISDDARSTCAMVGPHVEAARLDPRVEVEVRGQDLDGSAVQTIVRHGVTLVWIPPGTFAMGSPPGTGNSDERPQHELTLDGFYLAQTEVTNAQYALYLEANPGAPEPGLWHDERFNQTHQPVVAMTWHEAQAYCDWAGFVLPTEAQWEYAARAGTTTHYWFGDDETDLDSFGWYDENAGRRTHGVGKRDSNPFGLYDVVGNVFEWTRDAYVDYVLPVRPGDGLRELPPSGAATRVIRGGSWVDSYKWVRSASRYADDPGFRGDYVGFRPAMVLPDE